MNAYDSLGEESSDIYLHATKLKFPAMIERNGLVRVWHGDEVIAFVPNKTASWDMMTVEPQNNFQPATWGRYETDLTSDDCQFMLDDLRSGKLV